MANESPPGDPFEFLKRLWGPMGQSLPGMVTPTLDVGEIEKRIAELKSVETWLSMNLNMLKMTIQGLEMQRTTLNAFQSMGTAAREAGAAMAPTAESIAIPAWPWNLMPQPTPAEPPAPSSAATPPDAPAAKKPGAKR